MTATKSRTRPKRTRKSRAKGTREFPTLVLIPGAAALPAHRLADLQTLADVFAHEHGDDLDATKDRRAAVGARVGASREELTRLTRRAEARAQQAWDAAIREGLAELATETEPAVDAA